MDYIPKSRFKMFWKNKRADRQSLAPEGIDVCRTREDLAKVTEGIVNKYTPLEIDRSCITKCPLNTFVCWIEESLQKGEGLCDELAPAIYALGVFLLDNYETYKNDIYQENRRLAEKLEIPYTLDLSFRKNGLMASWRELFKKAGARRGHFFTAGRNMRLSIEKGYRKSDFGKASSEVKENIYEEFEKPLAELRRMTEKVQLIRLHLNKFQQILQRYKEMEELN